MDRSVPTDPSIPQDQFTPEEINFFQQNGYVIVRGLCDAGNRERMTEVTLEGQARLIEPVEFEADLHYPGAPRSRDAEGGRTVRRLKQALTRDYVFLQWVQAPSVAGRLRQLLGPEIICPLAHHNCIMTKEPQFSSDTGWHQDIRYWSYTRPDLVNVWMALGREDESNGCLQVIPGSHRMMFERHRFDDAVFLRSDLEENRPLIETAVKVILEPGDVLFFHSLTFHAATRNFSKDPKYSVVFTFRGSDNPPLPGSRSASASELMIR
jgi:phytanoyl-CoA hydroxylase